MRRKAGPDTEGRGRRGPPRRAVGPPRAAFLLLHRRVVEASSEAVLVIRATAGSGRVVLVNPAFEALTGFAAADLLGRTPRLLEPPGEAAEGWHTIHAALRACRSLRHEVLLRRKDAAPVRVDAHLAPIPGASGRAARFALMLRDVTGEHAARRRLAESEAAFRGLFERSPIPMWIYDAATLAFLSVNGAAIEAYGCSREAFLRMTILDIRPAEDRDAVRAEATQPRAARTGSGPWRHKTASGQERLVQIVSHLTEFGGRPAVLVAAHDVTAHAAVERDLGLSGAALQRQAVESRRTQPLARLGSWRWQPGAAALTWSPEVHAILGTDPAGPALDDAATLGLIHPEDRASVRAALGRILATGQPAIFEFRVCRPGGREGHCRAEGRWEADPAGGPGAVHGDVQDVTEQREAEAALRQAERLNALGQLTGGIAHDFNNLLTVASVSLEMAAEAARAGQPASELIEAARAALERGSRLTGQLLAYARRQPLRPQALDLGRTLPALLELIGRSLGERHPLRLVAAATEPVSADAAQFEAALVNLLVNARDAMPGGGPITIETAMADVGPGELGQLAAGRYVSITVADGGQGMSPEVLARAFEPFFTTKPPGRGTGLGLGLSMVLGFAQQSGGHVAVASEPGRGTTLRLLLPVAAEGTEPPAPPAEVAPPLPAGLDVLVVEDQPELRAAVVRLCRQVGLQAVGAADAAEALKVLGSGLRFDLLLTDVVLGGAMDGLELAAAARRLQPDLAVVGISGYPDSHAGPRSRLVQGLELLPKPFDTARFRAAIGRALAARQPAPA